MSIFEPSPWSNRMLAVLRIVAGAVFISAGAMKFGYPPSPAPMPPIYLAFAGAGAWSIDGVIARRRT